MDLSTVLSKIDLHQYGTVKEFLQDVDLIWQNALEYNPDRDPSGTRSVANSNVGGDETCTLVTQLCSESRSPDPPQSVCAERHGPRHHQI